MKPVLRTNSEAVARYISIPAEVIGDVGELLCNQHAEEKMKSRKVLLAILGNIRYLARQALPLRGNWNLETGSEENYNFYQLLKLRAEENSEILDWLRRKDDKYISPVIQNEILAAIRLYVCCAQYPRTYRTLLSLPSWQTRQRTFLTKNN